MSLNDQHPGSALLFTGSHSTSYNQTQSLHPYCWCPQVGGLYTAGGIETGRGHVARRIADRQSRRLFPLGAPPVVKGGLTDAS